MLISRKLMWYSVRDMTLFKVIHNMDVSNMQFLSSKILTTFIFLVLLSACSTSEFKAEVLSLDCNSAYTRCSPQVQPLEIAEVIVQLVDYQSDVIVIEEVPVAIPDIAPLLFEFDKSSLGNNYPFTVVDFLQKNKQSTVTLRGYIYQLGSDKYYQKLSCQRAQSFESLLVNVGVSSNQVQIISHGETSPKVTEISPKSGLTKAEIIAHYTPNRRVELEFDLSSFIAQSN